MPRFASAQQPAQELVALRDSVAAVSEPAGLNSLLVSVDQVNLPIAQREARKGWILLRAGELGTGRDELDQAIAAFDEALLRQGDWAAPWVGLARAKLLLAERQQPVKRSVHQPLGEHYDDAALKHLARSLQLQPKNPPAVALLTDLLIDREGLPLTGDIADAVERAAAEPANGPVPHLLLARDARLTNRLDEAMEELETYFKLGGDSALGLLEQARTEYRQKQLDLSVQTYLAGARKLDSLSRAAYRRDLAWTATPAEMTAFDSASDGALADWIKQFWARRDAEAVQPPGAALQEHFRRWFYALDHFHTVGEKRGSSQLGIAAGETAAGMGLAALDNPGLTYFETDLFRETPAKALGVDDRGLIYLRYGEPTLRATSLGESGGTEGCLVANESWRYDLPAGPRVFHFCASMALGTNAPTMLVPMLPLVEELLDSRIALDPRYAELAFGVHQAKVLAQWRARGMLQGAVGVNTISRDVVQRMVNEGRATIHRSINEDSYARYYEHDLQPVVQLYALGAADGAPSTALAVFALPGDKLQPQMMDGRIVYPVHVRLTAIDTTRGVSANRDTTRLFVVHDTLGEGSYWYGTATLPLGLGQYYVRALFDQPEISRGGARGRSGVVVPADGSTLTLSDLVPGRSDGLTYRHGTEAIPLNPLAVFRRQDAMQVYYELHGAVPGQSYETDITLARLSGDKPSDSDRLTLHFTDRPDRPTWPAQRSLSLERLKPGPYLLTVTVQAPNAAAPATRNVVVRIVK
ncbi:MAG TPA: hypothetical protein VFL95_08100 [Gemmatimonadales bacterium]|nr:hypothetical protein [Gemmatimonadales bacterium]